MKKSTKNLLRIGEIAKITDTSVPTLRYYEEIGLLKSAQRSYSNYRYYKESDISLITFVKKAQNIGFSLKEIKLILNERTSGKSPCPKVRHLAERKIVEVQEKIKELKSMEKDLKQYITSCSHESDSNPDDRNVCKLIDKVKI